MVLSEASPRPASGGTGGTPSASAFRLKIEVVRGLPTLLPRITEAARLGKEDSDLRMDTLRGERGDASARLLRSSDFSDDALVGEVALGNCVDCVGVSGVRRSVVVEQFGVRGNSVDMAETKPLWTGESVKADERGVTGIVLLVTCLVNSAIARKQYFPGVVKANNTGRTCAQSDGSCKLDMLQNVNEGERLTIVHLEMYWRWPIAAFYVLQCRIHFSRFRFYWVLLRMGRFVSSAQI